MEIIIHGRPLGQDIWTRDKNEDDIKYVNNYLDNKYGDDVSSLIVVDFVGNKRYYTYLRRKDFFEKDGQRPGSYFAITIVLQDKICKVSELYGIFDEAYNVIFKSGDIIKEYRNGDKSGVCYKIDKFEGFDWNKIVDWLKPKIDKCTQSYPRNAKDTEFTQPVLLSAKDVDSPYFFSLLPHKLLISLDYPCLADKIEQIASAKNKNNELRGVIASKDEEIARLNTKVSSEQNLKSKYETEKNKFEQENNNLKKALESSKQDVKELNVQKAAFKLQCDEYFKNIKDTPVEPEPDNNTKSFIKDNFLMILLLFMQFLMFIVLLSKSPDTETEVIEVENDTTIAVAVSRDTVFTVATKAQKIDINVNVRKDESKQFPELSKEYRIDLSGYNGTRVIDQLYYLSLINTNKNASAMNNCVYEVIEGDAKILENKALVFKEPDDKVVIRATSGDKKYYVERVFEKPLSNK